MQWDLSKINENLQIHFIKKNLNNMVFNPTEKMLDTVIQFNPNKLNELFLNKKNINYIQNYHPDYFKNICLSADIVKCLFCSFYF